MRTTNTVSRRALVVCTSCEIGGMERLAVGITRQLRLRGWDAALVFASGRREQDLLEWARSQGVDATAREEVANVLDPCRSWRSVLDMSAFVRRERPHVVNIHYGGAHISLKDVIAVRLASRVRCIAEVHLPVEWSASGWRKKLLMRIAGYLVDGVVVHSVAVREVVLGAGVASRKVHVVHPGIRQPTAHDRDDARARFGLGKGEYVIGCMSRLVQHKGVADLILAIPGGPDHSTLLVAGDGPERERLEQLANQVAPGRVQFLGQVDETGPFFAALDVFVLPSHSEGFGLVLIEAALHRVPVIGTRIGGVEDAVVDGVTGILVRPHDSAELARAMLRLFEARDLADQLVAEGYRRASREFTERAMGDAMESILTGRRTRRPTPSCAH